MRLYPTVLRVLQDWWKSRTPDHLFRLPYSLRSVQTPSRISHLKSLSLSMPLSQHLSVFLHIFYGFSILYHSISLNPAPHLQVFASNFQYTGQNPAIVAIGLVFSPIQTIYLQSCFRTLILNDSAHPDVFPSGKTFHRQTPSRQYNLQAHD